ncbi:hypothetical protein ACH41E_01270 [Streptomyces sp. NPDC020412]|uniref:hypothetical protein n=1 Tax=Streptomyces sp. NPDC020412 TaxID=3365073 RepID=UPI00379560AC
MSDHISALVSAFGAFASALLLLGSIAQYRSGASPLWVVAGCAILLVSACVLVRDVRRLRRRAP